MNAPQTVPRPLNRGAEVPLLVAFSVHRKAGTWFDDKEIHEWFAANLHRVREPSMRHYVRARELKAAGMDWMRSWRLRMITNGPGSPPSCWPAVPTAARRSASTLSSSRAEGAGRRFSTTGESLEAGTVMRSDNLEDTGTSG